MVKCANFESYDVRTLPMSKEVINKKKATFFVVKFK